MPKRVVEVLQEQIPVRPDADDVLKAALLLSEPLAELRAAQQHRGCHGLDRMSQGCVS